MELISLKYAIFVIALLVLYYCFPKKYRWYVLLAGSMAYYVIICKWYVLLSFSQYAPPMAQQYGLISC